MEDVVAGQHDNDAQLFFDQALLAHDALIAAIVHTLEVCSTPKCEQLQADVAVHKSARGCSSVSTIRRQEIA